MQSGMAAKLYGAAFRNGIAVGFGAIGETQSGMLRRDAHRLTHAVVVFYSPDYSAIATERGQRYAVFFGKRALKAQPRGKRALRLRFRFRLYRIRGNLFAQEFSEPAALRLQ